MNKSIPRIFITNDDGYKSVGIKYLKKINNLISKDIWVFAPEVNQSAKSQSITINKNIRINKLKEKEYIVKGTPCDCVILGLNKLSSFDKKHLLLLSGVNVGVNLGYDLIYSGTLAAAREGALNGIKSVAFSIDKRKKKINWSGLEYYAPKLISFIIKSRLSKKVFFNINFPSLSMQEIKGIKIVKLGFRKPGNLIKVNNNNYKIPSDRKILKTAKPGEDEYELSQGYITITLHTGNNLLVNNNTLLK